MATKRYSPLFDYLKKEYIDFSSDGNSERLISLYSDFSNLYLTNEYGYEVNIDYWHSLLLDCSIKGYLKYHGYSLVIDQNALADDFIRETLGKPIALGCVLEKMKKVGDIITLNEFHNTYKPPITWMKWIKQLTPTSLLSKSFSFTTASSLIPSSVYVVLPSVKTISQHIYRTYSHLTLKSCIKNSLLTFSEFRQRYGQYEDHLLTDADLILILKYLASQSTIALAENVQGYGTSYLVVKFIEPGMTNEITDHDKAIISIKTTCEALHHQINDLENLLEKLANSAKEYHNKKQQPQTLYALRRRKNVMKILEKKLMSMETMETMLLKMESAKDDMQIIQAFDSGATALRNILNEGFTTKSVEETMEKIQDIYDDQKDTENLLTEEMNTLNQSAYEDINDESLLKELEELELEQKQTSLKHQDDSNHLLDQLDHLEKPSATRLTSENEPSNNININHEKTPILE